MNYEKDVVSLIIPFYNAEDFLESCIDAVLAQTYSNIQLIMVDDGSTDGSNEYIKSKTDEIRKGVKEFVFLCKENGGAASAVNYALKYVKGEYLAWADCDDYLYPDNIKKKYEFLLNNKDYGLVICGAQAIDYETKKIIKNMSIMKSEQSDYMFNRILDGIPCYSGVGMLRTELLFEIVDNREIYYNKEIGQNYQLYLPVAYNNRCGFIDDILFEYTVRDDSHSHTINYEKQYCRTYITEEALIKILDFLPQNEKPFVLGKVKNNCEKERFNLSFTNNDLRKNNETYIKLKKNNLITFKIWIKHCIINNDILRGLWFKRFSS